MNLKELLSGNELYDLTDYRGCSMDEEILPNFRASFNSRTGVKRLTSTFPMFKFPDLDKINLRCTVMVCRKNCPVAKCYGGSGSEPQPEFVNVDIVNKFDLETFADVFDTEDNEIESVMRSPPPMRSEPQPDWKGNSYHKSEYSLDLKAASAASTASNVKKQESVPASTNDTVNEDMLCLSPARLALAFGILLVILLLALVASCTMWMRARSHLKRPKPTTIIARPAVPPRPPPGAAVVPPRGPFLIAPRPPYIRVMQ